jgi:hypothetical protein
MDLINYQAEDYRRIVFFLVEYFTHKNYLIKLLLFVVQLLLHQDPSTVMLILDEPKHLQT